MLAARTQTYIRSSPPPPHSPLYISQLLEAGKVPPRETHDAVRWLVPVVKASHKVVHEVLQNIALFYDSRFIVSNAPTFLCVTTDSSDFCSLISQPPI